jgi:hypothetical protein
MRASLAGAPGGEGSGILGSAEPGGSVLAGGVRAARGRRAGLTNEALVLRARAAIVEPVPPTLLCCLKRLADLDPTPTGTGCLA